MAYGRSPLVVVRAAPGGTKRAMARVSRGSGAGSAAPFGYQTNVLVYQMAGYRYMDFVRVGLPLNIITWVAAVAAINWFFPF